MSDIYRAIFFSETWRSDESNTRQGIRPTEVI
jgi:hypothetical protein